MNPAGTNWLSEVLSVNLRPAVAPKALWDRVWRPREAGRRSTNGSSKGVAGAWLWAAATVAVAVVMAVTIVPGRPASARLVRTTDPSQMRAWVRASTGLDVPLAPALPRSIELVEARAVENRAEIVFRVDGRETVLTANRSSQTRAAKGHADQAAWTAQGVSYQLNNAALAAEACRLCHGVI